MTVILFAVQVTASLNVNAIFVFKETPVALSAGELLLSVGAVLSNITLPLPLVAWLPEFPLRSAKSIVYVTGPSP